MDGQGSPEAEAVLAQARSVADGWEDQEGQGVEEKDRGQGHGDLMGPGPHHRGHRRDGATAADGCAHGDEQADIRVHLQPPGQPEPQGQDQGDAQGRDAQAVETGLGHGDEVHLGT